MMNMKSRKLIRGKKRTKTTLSNMDTTFKKGQKLLFKTQDGTEEEWIYSKTKLRIPKVILSKSGKVMQYADKTSMKPWIEKEGKRYFDKLSKIRARYLAKRFVRHKFKEDPSFFKLMKQTRKEYAYFLYKSLYSGGNAVTLLQVGKNPIKYFQKGNG